MSERLHIKGPEQSESTAVDTMNFYSLFYLFAVIAMLMSFGAVGSAEPMPEPRGRPATTKKPNDSKDDGGSER